MSEPEIRDNTPDNIQEILFEEKLYKRGFTKRQIHAMRDDMGHVMQIVHKFVDEGRTNKEILSALHLDRLGGGTPGEKTRFQELTEFFRDVAIILIVVLFIRSYIGSPFQISGSSMEESYHDKEFIIVNKISYADTSFTRLETSSVPGERHSILKYLVGSTVNLFLAILPEIKVGDPVRGDVVILRPHVSETREYYIKRVIGLPGDTIRFDNGEVFVKTAGGKVFKQLDEAYLSAINKGKTFLPPNVTETEFTVPAGEYFVMGDNRNNSSDSRSCFVSCTYNGATHYAKRSDIIGKVFLDLGYVNIFGEGGVWATKSWRWTVAPRFLNTPKDWTYRELP